MENLSAWEDQLLTVSEIAAVLKVPVSWVYERTRRSGCDRIPHIKLGKYLRFRWAAVRQWLEGLNQD
ncbi:MAG TPA: helix-turn-helix domain-containing protein [Terriglobales bacterium]|jgi:excisionase family DNA binding protein|nr:helix-turn-helix domain-containing protein [Terriglobales bacterium]